MNREALEEQKKLFEYHLNQQQKQRLIKQQLKKLEEMEKKNPEEHMLFIQKQFKAKSQSIEATIKLYKQKQVTFDILMAQYALAKEYYVNVSYALKTYDRQSYKQALDKTYNTIINLKKKNEPRKKFKFSRRDQDFGVKNDQKQQATVVSQSQSTNNIPGIEGRNNETITVSEIGDKVGSYKVVSCNGSEITILQRTEILFLKNLNNCTIRAALTKSTVFVDHCNDCTLEINCHQLRIHNSSRTTFKIFVTSKAIIEDCDKVVFTPYSFEYQNKGRDEEEFERKGKQNLWREIQDFNWLKQNQKSPHFQLIQS